MELTKEQLEARVAATKAREKEAKVKELAEAIYAMHYMDIMGSAKDAFLAAERFYEESERRWEAVK